MGIIQGIIQRKRREGEIQDFTYEESICLMDYLKKFDFEDFLTDLEQGAPAWLKVQLKIPSVLAYVSKYLNTLTFEARFDMIIDINSMSPTDYDLTTLIQHIRDAYIGYIQDNIIGVYVSSELRGVVNKLMDYDIKCLDILTAEVHFLRLMSISKLFKENEKLQTLPRIDFRLQLHKNGTIFLDSLTGDTDEIQGIVCGCDASSTGEPLTHIQHEKLDDLHRHLLLTEKNGIQEFIYTIKGYTYRTILRKDYVKNTKNKYVIGETVDITTIQRNEKLTHRLAYYDNLTGLANRELFLDKVKEQIENIVIHKDDNYLSAVMFIDIDDFKTINDTYGHDVGDKVLQEVARRLTRSVRQGDLVSRHSGDEFNILCRNIKEYDDIKHVANRIMHNISSTPFNLETLEIDVALSLGIAVIPDNGIDVQNIMKRADVAMYASKNNGKNRYKFFDDNMIIEELRKEEMKNELRNALSRDELFLEYLIQYDADVKKVTGIESLLRWNHPTRGEISANQFIKIAENSGLILNMGYWALEQGCKDLKSLHDNGFPDITLTVNFSQLQFMQTDLLERIQGILSRTHLDAKYLMIEITEQTSMEEASRTLKVLNAFKKMGIQLCLDDFGNGMSNLAYVHKFSLSHLKLNQAFTKQLDMDTVSSENTDLLTTYLAVGDAMKVSVIASAVETKQQFEQLSDLGCTLFQGYYFGKPMRLDKLFNQIPLVESQND